MLHKPTIYAAFRSDGKKSTDESHLSGDYDVLTVSSDDGNDHLRYWRKQYDMLSLRSAYDTRTGAILEIYYYYNNGHLPLRRKILNREIRAWTKVVNGKKKKRASSGTSRMKEDAGDEEVIERTKEDAGDEEVIESEFDHWIRMADARQLCLFPDHKLKRDMSEDERKVVLEAWMEEQRGSDVIDDDHTEYLDKYKKDWGDKAATTLQEDLEAVADVRSLKYVPAKSSTHATIDNGPGRTCFLAITRQETRRGQPDRPQAWLGEEYVRFHYHAAFVEVVKNTDGFVDVPAGCAKQPNELPMLRLQYEMEPLAYRQQHRRTCLYSSMACALDALGLSEAAKYVEITGRMEENKVGLRQQVSSVSEAAKFFSKGLVGKQIEYLERPRRERKKRKRHPDGWDPFNADKLYSLFVVVFSRLKDGGNVLIDHGVTIWNDRIYDSSLSHVLKLSEESLEFCRNSSGATMHPYWYVLRMSINKAHAECHSK